MASLHKIATTLIALLWSCNIIKGDLDETLIYKIGNGDTGTTMVCNSAVESLLQDLVDNTSKSGFNYYEYHNEFLAPTSYDHGIDR